MRHFTSIIVVFVTGCASAMMPARGQTTAGGPASLQLKVVEGDGAIYAPGSRATRGVGVVVTDENDRPVEGATVGFALPMSGPGGDFASGDKTEFITTKADGLAAAWGMRWNRTAGPFEIRVAAVKGQAKASITVTQYLSGLPQSSSAISSGGKLPGGSVGSHKWLWIALAGAAAAGAAGFAVTKKGSSTGGSSTASTASTTVQIGAPSVVVSP
jgi:hypothetical protein